LLTSYLVRLVCFSLASFFLINSALALIIWLWAPAAIRLGAQLQPSVAARFILALRLLPLSLSVFAVAGLCVPSYLWLEPKGTNEQAGWWCWVLTLLGVLTLIGSLARVCRALSGALRYTRECRQEGRELRMQDGPGSVLVVDRDAPILAVAGVVWPRIVVSSQVLRELSAPQLDAALGHERAHLASRDNLKRLLMLLAPDVSPFCRCFAPLERSWLQFAEWAADDQAVAGDSERSLSLASALLRVARMGSAARLPGAICFVADDTGLSARVHRLLRGKSMEHGLIPGRTALLAAASAVVAILAAAMLRPSAWYTVHQALEHLVR
jgi:beta-lactamase regulating signal transducer with metallopeptidase domain